MPVIQQLTRDVYQVIWDPSRENGAHVELYYLEGKTERGKSEKREVNFTLDSEISTRVEDSTVENDDSDNWVLYYNGTGMRHQYENCVSIRLDCVNVTFFATVKSLETCYLFTPDLTDMSFVFSNLSRYKCPIAVHYPCTANELGNILL